MGLPFRISHINGGGTVHAAWGEGSRGQDLEMKREADKSITQCPRRYVESGEKPEMPEAGVSGKGLSARFSLCCRR